MCSATLQDPGAFLKLTSRADQNVDGGVGRGGSAKGRRGGGVYGRKKCANRDGGGEVSFSLVAVSGFDGGK